MSEPEPAPVPATPEPRPGGSLRVALSDAGPGGPVRRALLDGWNRAGVEPWLDGVKIVDAEEIEPAELLLLDEADLAVVYGREVSRIREGAAAHRLVRAPGWDRTFALLCDTRARWTNDPNFRRWFAESVDRAGLARHLFGEHATPAVSLLEGPGKPRWAPPLVRPFGPTSRPVLKLGVDPTDTAARSIAARLKAAFAVEGLELRLVETAEADAPELTLVAHRRWADDAFESIETLIPRDADGARWYLRQAEAAAGESRGSLVALAEDAMLIDARLIPLVRLDAWVAAAPSLRGVEPGWTGDLAFEKLWWER